MQIVIDSTDTLLDELWALRSECEDWKALLNFSNPSALNQKELLRHINKIERKINLVKKELSQLHPIKNT
jgi:hypothetical protein